MDWRVGTKEQIVAGPANFPVQGVRQQQLLPVENGTDLTIFWALVKAYQLVGKVLGKRPIDFMGRQADNERPAFRSFVIIEKEDARHSKSQVLQHQVRRQEPRMKHG